MFFFDGMVDSHVINESLVRPVLLSRAARLSADALAVRVLQADDCRVEPDTDKALTAFLYGDTLVLTEGDARPLIVNTKGFARRSPDEPENERVLSGPREGFTDAGYAIRGSNSPFCASATARTPRSACAISTVCAPRSLSAKCRTGSAL